MLRLGVAEPPMAETRPTGLVVALAREARTLVAGRIPLDQPVAIGGGNHCWVSGMGAERARRAARGLFDIGCRRLVSWGFAGGLDPAARAGLILLPERILGGEGDVLPADPDWRSKLLEARGSPPLECEDLLTMDRVLANAAEKALLRKRFPAILVDLEAFSVGTVARERGMPFVAIKAPLDGVDQSVPQVLTQTLDPWGRLMVRRLPSCVARMRKADYAGVLQLWESDRQAHRALRYFARHLGWAK